MRIISLLLLGLLSASLQGCFPVVAAGVGTGVMVAQDRRTSGAYFEDQGIEFKASDRVGKQFGDTVHVNVTSYNRNVLLSGEVPNATVKAQVGKLVFGTENVRNVNNELIVAGASSLSSRSNDGMITSEIKLRFVRDQRLNADHVKVVTENGTVFLMGIVTRAEADGASEIASSTSGVQRVVKLFEYLD
jgi:osmotically-inducible protein OsmY